jgi:hypothetical protein
LRQSIAPPTSKTPDMINRIIDESIMIGEFLT